jgi:CRP-like cAMP-binding protein
MLDPIWVELSHLKPNSFTPDEAADTFPWAHDFDFRQIEGITKYMTAFSACGGQTLLSEGSDGSFMAIVLSGCVDIVKKDSTGVQKLIARLGPGKVIGEMGMIDGGKRSATATASTNTSVLVLSRNAFENMKQEKPRLALQVMTSLAKIESHRLRQTSGKLIELMTEKPRSLFS